MKNIIIAVVLSAFCIQGCKKENKINRNLEGTWTIKEYTTKKGFFNDFSSQSMTFQFSKYKDAYTRTMKGVYRIDYADVNKKPVVDTFDYHLKDKYLEITKVQNRVISVNGFSSNTINFLRRRFLLSNSASSEFTLTRVDTAGFYIRAIKQ